MYLHRKRLKKSQAQEKRLAKRHDGKLQAGSGCTERARGDVKSKRWLIEAKRTDKMQYTIKLSELEKHEIRSVHEGRDPLFAIEIQGKKFYLVWEDYFEG